MPTTEILLAGAIMAALCLYAVFGGADFGGGVWDLFASGPRKVEQRALIEKAIGPIWEANHVWLILAVVLLFSAFPTAFAVISIALHVPLTLFLIGVVFRGSAFTFRAYDDRHDHRQKRWGLLFSLASVASPLLLGILAGTVASGEIHVTEGIVTSGYFAPWLRPFPFVVGLFALALFAYLAAVYLTAEADAAGAPELAEDFRRRALIAGVAVGAVALLAFALSFGSAPRIRAGLTERPWTWPLHLATAVAATTAFFALWRRRPALARLAVVAQTTLILLGWAASQYPYLLVPSHTLTSAAANPRTQELLLIALGAGSLLLFPSLYVLYRVFKGNKPFRVLDRRRG
jgi:cytochrome bd ubiquinol oxidase subunit II